ncbi:MAG: tail fiber domain-containing protein [Sphingomonadales bacterium]|nr:tail fiber domain-containing protein [Sphingomonadales bacterium]
MKENIVRVGERPAGFGLYLFDYKAEFSEFGAGRQFGVMADEVEAIVPEAVTVGSHGFRMVNYALLGITRH